MTRCPLSKNVGWSWSSSVDVLDAVVGVGRGTDGRDLNTVGRLEACASIRRRRSTPRARRPAMTRASRPSPSPRPACPPRCSACASPTLVTTPMSGRAIAQRAATSPGNRSPISATTMRASGGLLSSVIGRPNSLLYDSRLAEQPSGASTAARRSFVDVLPAEPVTATTDSSGRAARRAARQLLQSSRARRRPERSRRPRASPRRARTRNQRNRRARLERAAHEVVAVASALQRDEAGAGFERARIERPRRDDRVGRSRDHACRPRGARSRPRSWS